MSQPEAPEALPRGHNQPLLPSYHAKETVNKLKKVYLAVKPVLVWQMLLVKTHLITSLIMKMAVNANTVARQWNLNFAPGTESEIRLL